MAQSLSNLPIGAKIKFGKYSVNGETAQDIIWVVAAKNHRNYPADSITCLTEKIIDLRAADAAEPNNFGDIRTEGNGDYGLSNIDQWLNKDATNWYQAAHSNDQAPNNTYVQYGKTGYDTRPGFLSNFTNDEKNILMSTNLGYIKLNYENNITRKVFLPSASEVGLPRDVSDGVTWEYFTNAENRKAVLTAQCFNNTLLSAWKPTAITEYWYYWTRSGVTGYPENIWSVGSTGGLSGMAAYAGNYGIRPAINLPSTLSISNTTDSDGCYKVTRNSAPPVPTTLNVPTIYGGKAMSISWSKVTDPDGDNVTYQLESSVNGGEFTTLYSGANLSYTTTVAYGSTSVQFRVKAIDPDGESSGYITSTSRTVINNTAPSISGSNGSLGEQNIEFTQTYKIEDAESNTVTVTEAIDGVQVRSYVVTLGAINTFSVTGNTWVKLANGNHTMTITATDGIDSSTRTYTFVKSVSSLMIQTSPMVASTRPTRIKVSVTKTIPPAATFKIEVCNNGYASDDNKVWEDATSAMNSGLTHLFDNTDLKDSSQWGVIIRVTVNRNGGSGECHVSAIGGNFE